MTGRNHRLAGAHFMYRPRQRAVLGLAKRGLQVGGLLGVLCSQVHADPCETLKSRIAQRMVVDHFVLEIMPAQQSLPPGAKVVGTCEGGARRVVFQRSGGQPSAKVPQTPTLPVAAPPEPSAVNLATAAPSPSPSPSPAPAPAPATAQVLPAPTPVEAVAASTAGASSQVPTAAVATPQSSAAPAEPSQAPASITARVSGYVGRHWYWLWVLLVLPVAGGWWLSHRLAYDAAGLPRGPRL